MQDLGLQPKWHHLQISGTTPCSPCEPFGETSAVPSCEEKGSAEGSAEPSPENQGSPKGSLNYQITKLPKYQITKLQN